MFHGRNRQEKVGIHALDSHMRLKRCPLRRFLPGTEPVTCELGFTDADISKFVLDYSRLKTIALAPSERVHHALASDQHGTRLLSNQLAVFLHAYPYRRQA